MRGLFAKSILLPLLALVTLSTACDEAGDVFDGGPPDEPNFTAEGVGENTETDLFIEIRAERENGNTAGEGTAVIGGEEFDIEVTGGGLPTDFDAEPSIPQTDDLLPLDFICTPRSAELTVRITPGDFETTITLNECEENNPEIFDEDGVVLNPCNGDAPVIDLEFFSGVCLDMPEIGVERGRDTIVLGEFNGLCGAGAPCIVPRDVIIFVPSFNEDVDFGDIIDEF
jgi:hypothetical protein